MVTKNALQLLSIYENDDESDEEVPFGRVSTKRVRSDEDDNRANKFFKSTRLPLPSIITRSSSDGEVHIDDPNEHDGRTRSFPHERGNWATYLYIPYQNDEIIYTFIEDLIIKTGLDMRPIDELHVSLTKTFVLKHHWINNFVDTVRSKLNLIKCFKIAFHSLKVYCNEDRTRTFLGVNIDIGCDSLRQVVKNLDDCLKEYNLPTFYEHPSFHMSLAWCIGDCESQLKHISKELNIELDEFIEQNKDSNWLNYINYIWCKSGNKCFQFELA